MVVRQHQEEGAGGRARDLALGAVDHAGGARCRATACPASWWAGTRRRARRSSRSARPAWPAAWRSRGPRGRRRASAGASAARSAASGRWRCRPAARTRAPPRRRSTGPAPGPADSVRGAAPASRAASIARAAASAFHSRCPPPMRADRLHGRHQHARARAARRGAARLDDLDDHGRRALLQPVHRGEAGVAVHVRPLARTASIASRIASGVAGARSGGSIAWSPAADTASRIARNTENGSSSGGSPTALLRWMLSSTFALSNSAHVEDRRAVVGRRDLVGAGRVRGELARLRMPHQLLGGEPAHALDERALDLADVDRRVQRAADVVQHVGAQQAPLAGERVHRDLGHGRAVAEVVERLALGRRPDPSAGPAWRRSRPTTAARGLRRRAAPVRGTGTPGRAPARCPCSKTHVGRDAAEGARGELGQALPDGERPRSARPCR